MFIYFICKNLVFFSVFSIPCENRKLEAIRLVSKPEVLLTVQTVHTGITSDLSHTTDNIDDQSCFLCNKQNSESFMDLYTTVTTYSKKSIYNFIWKFMDGNPSVRNDVLDASCLQDDVICYECLVMINEYDSSHEMAKKCKKQLCQRLKKTEKSFNKVGSDKNGNTQLWATLHDLE